MPRKRYPLTNNPTRLGYAGRKQEYMTKGYILECGELSGFKVEREVKDLAGTHFFTLGNSTTDLVAMYRDHKDGDYFLMGLYKADVANKMMDKVQKTR